MSSKESIFRNFIYDQKTKLRAEDELNDEVKMCLLKYDKVTLSLSEFNSLKLPKNDKITLYSFSLLLNNYLNDKLELQTLNGILYVYTYVYEHCVNSSTERIKDYLENTMISLILNKILLSDSATQIIG